MVTPPLTVKVPPDCAMLLATVAVASPSVIPSVTNEPELTFSVPEAVVPLPMVTPPATVKLPPFTFTVPPAISKAALAATV